MKREDMEIVELTWQDTIPVRHQVLWPNELPEFCIVEGDQEALHFGVIVDNIIVSVASLYIDANSARLRKFATLSAYQGKGVGSSLLKHLIQKLKEQGVNYLWFDARKSALSFYNRFDFQASGDVFYKNEVPYYNMHSNL